MVSARASHTAFRLKSGFVLLAAGRSPGNGYADNLATAELYDPSSGQFKSTGSLKSARAGHTMTLLADSRVNLTVLPLEDGLTLARKRE